MRKISREEMIDLRRKGVRLKDEAGNHIKIPKVTQKEAEKPRPAIVEQPKAIAPTQPGGEHQRIILASLAKTAQVNGETMASMAAAVGLIGDALKQISRPVPQKRFRCTVGRNSDGKIKSIEIQEQ
jgi:hypothetical protein